MLSGEKGAVAPTFPTGRGADLRDNGYEKAPVKSLKDRIEEARNDPAFPRQAMEVIEKNKTSAVGHSGPKYTELIETLLAVPWGKIQKIDVRPEDFEEGLNRTHYGLKKPKEILCDFFTNLIWRYQRTREEERDLYRTGSAFLFVGPPGVGKISLGGMSDETDLRGHGFTWEGSKPGAVVQGLIKMGIMNGMFIMDEADKTEKFAIATLLEILDPEQNHLFHDKYTQTIVDIDLSGCHFILTANTLETVPPAVVDRCEVIFLDRYGVEEKVAIARRHLIVRVRRMYRIREEEIAFKPGQEADLLRYMIKTYTYEPGVRQLERIIRTLFLRIFRKEILRGGRKAVRIDREMIKSFANNYTRQGFKIKECKPVLNRVLCHLAMMSTEQLDACPFLTRFNGIYMVDLSFIPEKYRLDTKRAESLLNRCLKAWLTTLEEELKQVPGDRTLPRKSQVGI